MRSERNILRHEIIGLQCEVVNAKNKSLVGIRGRIVDETMKTLVIDENKRKRIAKQGTRFQIALGGKRLIINGDLLVARPEDRIKKKLKKW
ncbi:MAG: ribonuclease P protein subunit [Candidatus Aenigmarchaeota archaeon]|nr:ribonuclease P protein subunit [Candidatus Aenigmarchaeota archaeon]